MVLTLVAKNEVKNRLRAQLRRQREERYTEHNLLHLIDIPEIKSAQVIASYFSIGTEPDTAALNQAIIASGKILLLPRINGQLLDWIRWDGKDSTIATNGKFFEPIGEPFTDLDAIDFILVPALAIDPDGYRLGQGGGFYDRELPKLRGWKHGVVYNYERMEHDLPREPWDVPVNSW